MPYVAVLTLLPYTPMTLPYSPTLPDDATEYKSAIYTQSVFRLNDRPTLRLERIRNVGENQKWTRSGGIPTTTAFSSRKYRSGGKPTYKTTLVSVKNSFGHYQNELGLTRTYPDGARFDDVLYNEAGGIFEHRIREKIDGKWRSRVEYKEPTVRPNGYNGLTETCASCHNQAGTGDYGVGLVPGGDTVLSDPMDWSQLRGVYYDGPTVVKE